MKIDLKNLVKKADPKFCRRCGLALVVVTSVQVTGYDEQTGKPVEITSKILMCPEAHRVGGMEDGHTIVK